MYLEFYCLWVLQVPGENEWVKEAFSPTDGLGATAAIRPLVAVQGEKRPRDAEGAEVCSVHSQECWRTCNWHYGL